MEIYVVLELLSDQAGADHLAVAFDQASLCLLREDRAGDFRHGKRIGKARNQGQQDQYDDGGADFSEHGIFSNR